MRAKYLLAGIPALLVAVLDQAVKMHVRRDIPLGGFEQVVPGFFSLVHVENTGAAFGFMNTGSTGWQTYFLIGATLAALLLVFHLLRTAREDDRLMALGLGLILGGAVGNLVDRLASGRVTDFLDFYVGRYHWPAFNIADAGISAGAILLIVSFLSKGKHASDPD